MIRYRDLTEEQKSLICNGCGPKGGWVPVPELFLHEVCDHHDFNYWIGYRERDRRKADYQLWEAARKKARWDPVKQSIAMIYFLAVRAFGMTCFHYAEKERDEHDLERALAEKQSQNGEGEGNRNPLPNGDRLSLNDQDGRA